MSVLDPGNGAQRPHSLQMNTQGEHACTHYCIWGWGTEGNQMRQSKPGTTAETLERNGTVIKWDFLCFLFGTRSMESASQGSHRGL